MTFDQYAAEHLAQQREILRLLRLLCRAMGVAPARAIERHAQVLAMAGGVGASQARRKRKAG